MTVSIQNIYRLTPLQEGILFHHQFDSDSDAYFEQLSFTLARELNPKILNQSLNTLIERYDVLRTAFVTKNVEQPLQVVMSERTTQVHVEDITSLKESDRSVYVNEYMINNRQIKFDLEQDVLMRLALFKISDKSWRFVWSFHHIILDGWCLGILLKDLFQIYDLICQGDEILLNDVQPYSLYFEWLDNQEKDTAMQYWKEVLSGYTEASSLQFQKKYNKNEIVEHKRYNLYFEPNLTKGLENLSNQYQVTLSSVMHTIWGILLQKYNQTDDAVFGSVISGRPPEISGIESMVGLFVNTVPLRVRSLSDTTFIDLTQNVHQLMVDANKNGFISLSDIQSSTTGNNQIIDHVVAFENYPIESLGEQTSLLSDIDYYEHTNYDFSLTISPGVELEAAFTYSTSVYDSETIVQLGKHLLKIAEQVVSNASVNIRDIDLKTETEKKLILEDFNDTVTAYPTEKTISELFQEQVRKTPDHIALQVEVAKLTYRELNEQANQIAVKLQSKGTDSDEIVAVMADRSMETIIAELGIIKAGGAYLPLSPEYPAERIGYLLGDSRAKIVLTKQEYAPLFEEESVEVLIIDQILAERAEAVPAVVGKATDLAYVMYTSGTTGKPKGVMIEHRNVVRLVKNTNYAELETGGRMLQTGELTFDASTFEIWGALLNGMELHLVDKNVILDPSRLEEVLKQREITTAFLTSPLFNQLALQKPEMFRFMKELFIGGDVLPTQQVKRVRQTCPTLQVVHVYGPTESTTFATSFLISQDYESTIPIGKPISNTTAYVVGREGTLCPIGVPGELWIGGDGLARGYLHQEELTATKFVTTSFHGQRAYRTGDMAKWQPDGTLVFIGRVDNQIKIRGYRVEIDEIEKQILQHTQIKEAVVTVLNQGDAGVNLCAYVVAHGNAERTDIKKYLTDHLPNYMVPSFFVYLDRLPLTANGKIDREALPQPELQMEEYKAPSSQTEQTLASIWSEILGVEKISATASFFDLGGHSLKAISVVSAIQKELGVEVSLQELFEKPVLEKLAAAIDGSAKKEYVRVPRAKEAAWYPVSFAQRRMMILNEMEGVHTAYNMPTVLQLEGNIDMLKLETVFCELIERHEAFRTSLRYEEGEPVQVIHPEVSFEIEVLKDGTVEEVIGKFVRPFDLSKAPLIRVGTMQEVNGKQLMLIDMHHIISDGVSMNLLAEEFDRLYCGEKLPELEIQYKDYAVWQQAEAGNEHYQAQEAYWLERLSGDLPVLKLPTDYPRPQMQSFEGAAVSMQIDHELSGRINELAAKHGATQYMVMLAALNVLLSKYTGQEDIIVGTSVAGRTHADLSGVMGMFVNALPMRSKPVGNKTFQGFLEEVKEQSLAAFDNQDYPYEALVEKLNVRRDSSRNPLFDVMLNVQSSDDIQLSGDSGQVTLYQLDAIASKFDIRLVVEERPDDIGLYVEYSTKLFQEETVLNLTQHLITILDVVAKNEDVRLSEIEMLSPNEREQLLYSFNDTVAAYPQDKTIHELFEVQVEQSPTQVAVRGGDDQLTYQELQDRANILASLLRDRGVRPGDQVAILLEPSVEIAVSILGILKTGSSYVPLDPETPEERLQYQLKDSDAQHVVTVRKTMKPGLGETTCLYLDDIDWSKQVLHLEETGQDPEQAAYVIYTSGTTGKPKGVEVTHRNVLNYVSAFIQSAALTTVDKTMLVSSYAFDLGYTALYSSLLSGGELHFVSKEQYADPEQMIGYWHAHGITYIKMTPSLLSMVVKARSEVRKGSQLRLVVVGGESIRANDVAAFLKQYPAAQVMNHYGPTETTIGCITQLIEPSTVEGFVQRPVIGRPIANTQVYIVQGGNTLVPPGVYGELCISGDGVAKGYLGRMALTEERFQVNPYRPESRWYRTGDIARWLPNGTIEFAGRRDHQIKVRGYRVELGEIEEVLLKQAGIRQAAVKSVDHGGDVGLCAYVVGEEAMNETHLREQLLQQLPHYMIPSHIVFLETLPMNSNGKIARDKLQSPESEITSVIEEPQSEMEKKVASIWREVLGIEEVSRKANFIDLGGHSLKAIQTVLAIRKELGVEVSLQELFQKPVLEEMAAAMEEALRAEYVRIPRAKEAAWYPVSFAQRRMMILNEMEGIQTAYNMPTVLQLEGNVDMLKMEEVFRQLIERHEAFRTSLHYEEGEPVQVIHSDVPFSVETLTGELVEEVLRKFVRPFNLMSAPLLRVGVMQETNGKQLMLIDMHHIISDGASMNLFAEEFDRLYSGEKLPELEIQYKDYAVWQQAEAGNEHYQAQEAYWLERLSGDLPVLELPTDYPRPQMQSFEGAAVSMQIDHELSGRINELAKKHGATQYMVMLAALNVLLSKYTGQEDIIVGTSVAGRTHGDLSGIMGMFVNALPMRSKPVGNKTFQGFLEEVKEQSLAAFDNQDYPYEALVEKLNVRRDSSRNPLFDVMLNVQSSNAEDVQLSGDSRQVTLYPLETITSKFDIRLVVEERPDDIGLYVEYSTKLFQEETVLNLTQYLITILDVVAKNEDVRLSEIEMLSPNEREQLLYSFNDTVAAYPQDKTIHELFEVQVEQSPTQVAVRGGDDQLTYQELQDRANILASLLRDRGVKPGDQVAILLEPSVEIAVSILGILKTGSSYVPLDPETPEERLQYQLKDSDAQYVVTVRKTMKPGLGETTCLYLDDIDWSKQVLHLEETGQGPEQAAYVIYTSGTTGKPKGVEVTHRNVLNYVSAFIQSAALTTVDKTMLVSSYAFDLGYTALYSSLLSGGELHFVSKEQYADPEQMIGYWHAQGITYVKMTPSLLSMVVKARSEVHKGSQLRLVVVGGESIRANDVAAFLKQYPAAQVMNHYGPTETTIGCITQLIEPSTVEGFVQRPVIGRPIANTQVYIVQGSNTLVPPGVYGELCISGDGVAKGYLGRMALTEERFQVNPYRPESRWYRTGDIARWLPNGTIEFAGRRDHQIKVRGYRVELGEIEEVLLKQAGIRQAAVKSVDHGGDVGLCAYVVGEEAMNETHLREQLLQQLPHYMIPSHIVFLETLPMNSNGKIARDKLQSPESEITSVIEEPQSEMEKKVASIWREVLGIEEVSRKANFIDLGGHSLKAIQTVLAIRKELGVEVSLQELFQKPVLEEMAAAMEEALRAEYVRIPRAKEAAWYPVSFAQRRMMILNEMEGIQTAYNMPTVLQLEGNVDMLKMEEVFRQLIERHEAFRTSLHYEEGEPVQVIHSDVPFSVETLTGELVEEVLRKFVRPFNLMSAPLLRVGVMQETNGKQLMLIDMHHIISDGASMNLFAEEFDRLYSGEKLPELEIQYKDYAVWQQAEAGNEHYQAQEAYWLERLSGDLPVLELPTDYPRPQMQSFEGAAVSMQIDHELSGRINELAKKHGATQYMVMLAALNVLLSKYTGQEDIIVGTSVAGRTHGDLSGIMGMFVNALPMRSKPVGNKTFQGFLEEVKEQSLAAFDNQDYPYEALVEKLNVRRDSSRNPVFDVMLNVRNFDSTNLNLEGSTIKPYQSENEISKFDLTLTVNQDQDEIDLFFEYATKLFKKDTIDRMIEHFITILRAAAKSGDILLSEIDILAEMEKENLINLGTKTKTAYPANKSISVLFTEQLERTPDSIAIQDREQRLTYRQLNERANHIAVKLQQLGVGSDDIVAILADRSIETIVMELGVIKAGGAYLPISPDSPEERINYFLMDSDTKVVLTKNCFAGTLRNGNAELLIIEELSTQKELALPIDNSKPNDLAYVMYTSGTTGKPKGVMVEHRNVVRLVKNTNYIRFEEGKRMVQTGDLTFDASTFEIWGALLNGMELHIIDKNTLLNSKQLEEVLNNRNIDTMWLTSPLFNELSTDNPNMFRSLKQLVIGGDVLSPSKVREVVKKCKNLNIINGYGPTENTTFSCSYLIEESINDNSIPIGRPINNSTVFVVNNHGQLCPTGVPGELWVGGDGVARGYLNEESLTKEKFIASPFNSNEKLYRTGDLVKWLKDGNLEYLGRIDDQVKIRGHRIEIGEIETVLMKHDAIKQAYINTKTVQDELVLCAYIVTQYPLRTELIKKHLLNYLPSYMVPTFFIQMDRLPLTENGKVDRDALPQPEVKEIPAHKVPFSDTERKLAQIWSEILGIDGNIGAEASFFELGGHSLKAIGLLSAIRKEFGVEINLQELFQKPALDELAATIDGSTKTLYARIPRVEKKDWYPVSFAQRRMMILNEMEGIHTTYNMPTVLQLEGNVDMSRLEEVFRQLIKRHEVFRTSLHYQDGEPVQVIHPEISFAIENLTGENIEVALKEFVRPFDLTVAPLLRVGVLRAADEKKLLFIDMHHIISDGVSSSILAEEFDRLYNGQELPELDVQYKDYAVWQQEGAGHDLYKAQETYWLELLSGNLPVIELPTDYPRPQLQTFEGNVVSMHVDQELSTRINEIATRHGATNYMVMLAALNVLLSKYTDQEDILVGTPVAGRTHADIQDTFGLFVNTVVMRNQLKKGQLFKDFLLEVKQNAINAFENQDYPFESLIDKLNVKRDFSRNPVVDLMLTIRNINSEKMEANSINATSHPITLTKTKFDLTITVLEEHNGTMQLQFEYATKLFREETVTRMAQHFTNILSIVTDNEEIEL